MICIHVNIYIYIYVYAEKSWNRRQLLNADVAGFNPWPSEIAPMAPRMEILCNFCQVPLQPAMA